MNPRVSVPKIFPRGNRWYVRVQVPKEMQSKLRRKEYWVSLKTSDRIEALQRATAATQKKRREISSVSRPRQGVWYGYSIFIPADFVSLGRANTYLSQVKVNGEGMPLWQLTFNDNPYILYSDDTYCSLGPLVSWRGRWNDVTVYAHYGDGGQSVYFQLYRNGRLLCERNRPLMHPSRRGRRQEIGFKYGVYNSFVSKYLRTHDRLPTHVIFYDEMLAGSRREDVDVRMREAAGLSPVD